MSWSETSIDGKAADLFIPKFATNPAGVVLFLHGYDGVTIKNNPVFSQQLTDHSLIGLCPIGPRCWWTDAIYEPFDAWVGPVEFLAQNVPAFCQREWHIDAPRIAVCGIEMGGQGALQLAYRHARQFPITVAISPKIDFETWWGHGTSLDDLFPDREAARQRTATLHVHPLNYPKHQLLLCDPADIYCIDGVLTLASKLSSSGIPYDCDFQTSHGGFGWTYANAVAPRAIEYMARALQQIAIHQI
jgi:hypothetical protein